MDRCNNIEHPASRRDFLCQAGGGFGALAELCDRYWYPLYAYVRRRGHEVEDARDLTQAFFAKLLEKQDLKILTWI